MALASWLFMESARFHEEVSALRPETLEMHRAIVSLMEELDAVDWYGQRVDASSDRELAAVLAHNRREEIEHACMVLEWIRRHDAMFDRFLRTYLFTSGAIDEIEQEQEGNGRAAADEPATLGGTLSIGSLRDREAT